MDESLTKTVSIVPKTWKINIIYRYVVKQKMPVDNRISSAKQMILSIFELRNTNIENIRKTANLV